MMQYTSAMSDWVKLLHDVGASAKGTKGESTAELLAQRRHIRIDFPGALQAVVV